MKKRIRWIAALLVAGCAGWTTTATAGPGIGAFGPWNSGGAYGGYGPYEPAVRGAYGEMERPGDACYMESRTTYVRPEGRRITRRAVIEDDFERTAWVERRGGRRIVRAETPVRVIRDVSLEAPPIVAERVESRPSRAGERVLVVERKEFRPVERSYRTRRIVRHNPAVLEPVGERVIVEPAVERTTIIADPAINDLQRVGPLYPNAEIDYNNPYR